MCSWFSLMLLSGLPPGRVGGRSLDSRSARCAAYVYLFCFFFQAEDGIRDVAVTGVQTCALPISSQALPHADSRLPLAATAQDAVGRPRVVDGGALGFGRAAALAQRPVRTLLPRGTRAACLSTVDRQWRGRGLPSD